MIVLVKGDFDPFDQKALEFCKKLTSNSKVYIKGNGSKRSNDIIKVTIKSFHKLELYTNQKYDHEIIYDDKVNIDLYLFNKLTKSANKLCQNKLYYYYEVVAKMISKKRYDHTLNVIKYAKLFAKIHHLDEKKAELIALLHDSCKELTNQKELMNKYFNQYLFVNSAMYHQYIGALYTKKYFRIYDNDIYIAIKHHTDGLSSAKYSALLYIADKIEDSRGFDNSNYLKITTNNLIKGFKYTKYQSYLYLKNKGVINE